MSNVIRFLESMASNPSIGLLSAADYASAVAALDADEGERDALLRRDAGSLSEHLGGRSRMLCALMLPEKERPIEEEDAPGDDVPDETPADKPSAPKRKPD